MWAVASTVGQMLAVAWMMPPLWVSSKSRPCTRMPLSSAASRGGRRSGRPMTGTSPVPPRPEIAVAALCAKS